MSLDDDDGMYVAEPKTDAYVWLLMVTFVATLIAVALMFLEYNALG